jgi:hypothetical protein
MRDASVNPDTEDVKISPSWSKDRIQRFSRTMTKSSYTNSAPRIGR